MPKIIFVDEVTVFAGLPPCLSPVKNPGKVSKNLEKQLDDANARWKPLDSAFPLLKGGWKIRRLVR